MKKNYRNAKVGVSITPADEAYLDLICVKYNLNRSQAISFLIRTKIQEIIK